MKNNQSGREITQIDYLGIIGTPISVTNMSDFKRVSVTKFTFFYNVVSDNSLVGGLSVYV